MPTEPTHLTAEELAKEYAMEYTLDSGEILNLITVKDFTEAVEAVRRELAGRWIAVTERLPELGDIVLTYNGAVANVYRWTNSTEGVYSVTHWKPLPAPPAQQEGQ